VVVHACVPPAIALAALVAEVPASTTISSSKNSNNAKNLSRPAQLLLSEAAAPVNELPPLRLFNSNYALSFSISFNGRLFG